MKKIMLICFLIPAIVHAFAFHFHLFPKQLISGFTATGGTITYLTATGTPSAVKVSGGYTVHTFTSGTTNFVTSGGSKSIEYLIVAGGGGGAQDCGGGAGGAGGLLQGTLTLNTGNYPIVIGAGGSYSSPGYNASNGGSSSFNNINAIGGGGAGTGDNYYVASNNGASGGSGGGAGGGDCSGNDGIGGSGTPLQGNAGGSGSWSGGSGGGAGGIGLDGGGAGGAGLNSSISGFATMYARGGDNNFLNQAIPNSGNGGAGQFSSTQSLAMGSSGIVIIRYKN